MTSEPHYSAASCRQGKLRAARPVAAGLRGHQHVRGRGRAERPLCVQCSHQGARSNRGHHSACAGSGRIDAGKRSGPVGRPPHAQCQERGRSRATFGHGLERPDKREQAGRRSFAPRRSSPDVLDGLSSNVSKLSDNLSHLKVAATERVQAANAPGVKLTNDTFAAYRDFGTAWNRNFADLQGQVLQLRNSLSLASTAGTAQRGDRSL